jgi:hypothetical protein
MSIIRYFTVFNWNWFNYKDIMMFYPVLYSPFKDLKIFDLHKKNIYDTILSDI